MKGVTRYLFLVTGFVCMLLLASCGGTSNNNALNPQFQPQVNNAPDNFQFQTTGVTNVTQTLDYSWQNSGTRASVNQACAITGGTATLTLRDPQGLAVYSGDLSANGTFSSIAGTTGTWNVHIELTRVNGTLNFRVQKL